MIYVSQDQLEQVEYLINQSKQGNHILFDVDALRTVFSHAPLPEELSEDEAYAVEHHIERLILQPTLAEKRAYLEQLDKLTFRKVVKTYFNIVENNIIENHEVKH